MEFQHFKSQLHSQMSPSPLADNIRYILAKKKIDELFVKWMSLPQAQEVIQKLIGDIKSNPQAIINGDLSAFLTSQKVNLTNASTINLSNSLKATPHTPPKSPNDFAKWGKGLSGTNDSDDSSVEASPRPFDIGQNKQITSKNINKDDSLGALKQSESAGKAKNAVSKHEEQKETKPVKIENKIAEKDVEVKEEYAGNKMNVSIPKFYFGNSINNEGKMSDDTLNEINDVYSSNKNEDLNVGLFEPITSRVFELPKFLNPLVFARVDKDKRGKISKSDLIKVWKSEYAHLTPQVRCFNVIKKSACDYISPDDFKPVMNIIMAVHPGLEFLQATPEFQDRYSDTVIQRILYTVDKNDDGKISKREFTQSTLFNALKHLDNEDDVNKVRAYFSYEHFYVLYCKFWELDSDHDFMISKEEFSRYSGHALSKKAVDRIFDGVPRAFRSGSQDKMSYEDFIWFALSEEDKTTDRSLEYWFKVMDLDQNDIITGYEMEFFYEEQKQRLEYLNHEPVYFEDIVCQLVDMFHPEKDIIFRMDHFKQRRQLAGTFFNCMLNLNKFVSYEQRDPFSIRNEINENPDFTEWDRFAMHEYKKLAEEEENAENSEMLDSGDAFFSL